MKTHKNDCLVVPDDIPFFELDLFYNRQSSYWPLTNQPEEGRNGYIVAYKTLSPD